MHDPFAGPGLRLAKLCDAVGATFTGADIEAWPGADARVRVADARDAASYPPAPFTVVTSPVYLNKRLADYPNGVTPRTKTKGRRDYAISLGRALHPDNLARVTGRPSRADGYWQRHREAVRNWGPRVILNVDEPIEAGWIGLLAERGYRIEETIPAHHAALPGTCQRREDAQLSRSSSWRPDQRRRDMSDLFEPELSGLERFRRTLNEGGLIERTEVEGTGRSRILAGDLDCGHTTGQLLLRHLPPDQ